MHANDYREAWIRNLVLFVFLGYLPFGYVVMTLLPEHLWIVNPIFLFAGIWMVLYLVVAGRLSAWHCPTCGKRFSGTWLYDKGFLARKCAHCGLPKFAVR